MPTRRRARRSSRAYTVEVSGKRFDVKVIGPPFAGAGGRTAAAAAGARRRPPQARRGASAPAPGGGGGGGDTLASPLQGTVLKVAVEQGAAVEEGALICVIEAMKMENEITAHKAGHRGRAADRRRGLGGQRRHAGRDQRQTARPSRAPTLRRRRELAFSAWMRSLDGRLRRGRQRPLRRRRSASAVEVREVLLEDRGAASPAVDRRAVAGDHGRRAAVDERREPPQRLEVRGRRAAGGDHRDLDRREVVAAHEHLGPRAATSAIPSAVWPVGGVELELGARSRATAAREPAAPARPPARAAAAARCSAPRRTSRSARWAAPGSASQALGARLGAAERRLGKARRPSRWSQSACVASSPETGKPACSSTPGSASSSSGSTGESITNPSSPLAPPCTSSARRG